MDDLFGHFSVHVSVTDSSVKVHECCSRLGGGPVVCFNIDLVFSIPLGWTGVNERTFIAVKPDGVQRRLVGEIVRRFEKKGFKLVGLKLTQVCFISSKNIFSGDAYL